MEFLIVDKDRMETGQLNVSKSLDLELGGTNDFEITLAAADNKSVGIDFGCYIFAPGTEYGGIIEDKDISTASNTVKWYGWTWRGLLDKSVIEPPAGLAYRTVSGEVNKVIAEVLRGRYGGFFVASNEDTGVRISYQFRRYATVLGGLSAMLAEKNMRLRIWADQGGTGEPFRVMVGAVPIVDYSEEIEYSQDNKVNLSIRDYRRGINHLICLGQGELTERTVIHLYVQRDGTIGKKQCYKGFDERSAVYDYSAAEDEEDLESYGRQRLKELANYKKLSMTVQDLDLDIGDIVAGRDRETGTYISQPITGKILRIDGLKETIEYTVKGDE